MSQLERAIAAGLRDVASVAGKTVTLRNGAGQAIELKAVIGSSTFDEEQEDGTVLQVESRDFIVAAADLDWGAGPVKPERDWEIDELIAGTIERFLVNPAPGVRHFERHDPYGYRLRLHTQRIKKK